MSGTATSGNPIPDPIAAGIAAGWKVIDAAALDADLTLEADVAIVGTGAGGAISAEILALSGLTVIMLEEGAMKSSQDFRMRESEAYPDLYQEAAARKTKDKAINILQGRTVGGSTTVNWTASFRTPASTLEFWQRRFGLGTYTTTALAPWFTMVEHRLGVSHWQTPPNENNDLLRRGASRLGIATGIIQRNVKGCWNLGYCGMGCPTNAKQSMLVTSIPSALSKGATLVCRARADKVLFNNDKVTRIDCVALDRDGLRASGWRLTVLARHYVVAGGAINTPALLMRSGAPDASGMLGRRTFLHPTVTSAALFEQKVHGYAGAPQSIYSDEFLDNVAIDGPLGFKLETPPLHPVLVSTVMPGFGSAHRQMMEQYPHMHALLALLRDGFHEKSPGGIVRLRPDGSPELDYPLNAFHFDGVKRALLSMAEIQFAAGAKSVYPVHEMARRYTSWAEARQAIQDLPYRPLLMRVLSAHVMGGCTMSDDPRKGVVTPDGRYHGISNLSIHDGSLFPTSIGANPQISIYAIAARMSGTLARHLGAIPPAAFNTSN
jgi:choline dehydrogenase-like flavoprotein